MYFSLLAGLTLTWGLLDLFHTPPGVWEGVGRGEGGLQHLQCRQKISSVSLNLLRREPDWKYFVRTPHLCVHTHTHKCWQDKSETVTFVLLNPSMCPYGSLWSFDDDQSRGKVCPNSPALANLLLSLSILFLTFSFLHLFTFSTFFFFFLFYSLFIGLGFCWLNFRGCTVYRKLYIIKNEMYFFKLQLFILTNCKHLSPRYTFFHVRTVKRTAFRSILHLTCTRTQAFDTFTVLSNLSSRVTSHVIICILSC